MFVTSVTAIAFIVDVARMSVYGHTFDFTTIKDSSSEFITAIVAVFLGAYIGNKLLKKTTSEFLKWVVTIFMEAIYLSMILSILT